MANEQSVHELETVVAQRDAAMARVRNLEVAIRHAVETSERLHPTAECCGDIRALPGVTLEDLQNG